GIFMGLMAAWWAAAQNRAALDGVGAGFQPVFSAGVGYRSRPAVAARIACRMARHPSCGRLADHFVWFAARSPGAAGTMSIRIKYPDHSYLTDHAPVLIMCLS